MDVVDCFVDYFADEFDLFDYSYSINCFVKVVLLIISSMMVALLFLLDFSFELFWLYSFWTEGFICFLSRCFVLFLDRKGGYCSLSFECCGNAKSWLISLCQIVGLNSFVYALLYILASILWSLLSFVSVTDLCFLLHLIIEMKLLKHLIIWYQEQFFDSII